MRGVFLPAFGACLVGVASAMAQESTTPGLDQATVTNRMAVGDLVLRAGAGSVAYRETASIDDVDSDFEAAMFEFGVTYIYTDRSGFKLRAAVDGWASDKDQEEWRGGGQVLQRNQLQTSGFELEGAFGYDVLRVSPQELNLWLGLGSRAQGFERNRFRSFNEQGEGDSAVVGSVQEDYLVGLFRFGADGSLALTPKVTLSGDAAFGIVFFSQADNEVLGTIDGNGGSTVDLGVDLSYAVSAADAVGAGLRYQFQELDGDVAQALFQTPQGPVQQVAEWPDNELERVLVDLFWKHRF